MEHKVPAQVLKSLEDKARKAAAKNAIAAMETKKRKGAGTSKVASKRRKTMPTSVAASVVASTDADEEVAENIDGGSTSMGAGTEGDCSTASLDLGGDDFVETILQGMGGGATAEPSVVAPMPAVLGDNSSGFEEEIGGGDAPHQRMRRLIVRSGDSLSSYSVPQRGVQGHDTVC